MPCYDHRNEPEYVRKEAREEFRHNSDVAELLCEAMKIIKAGGLAGQCSPALGTWSLEHDLRDRKREKPR